MEIRCFFTRDGHFAGVETLPEGSRSEVIEWAEALFKQCAEAEKFDGFEIWYGDHLIYQTNGLAVHAPSRAEVCGVLLGVVACTLHGVFY